MPIHRPYRNLHLKLLGSAVGCLASAAALNAQTAPKTPPPADVSGEIEEFVGYGGEDPNMLMPTQPLEGALGFAKSIVETPRSVSTIGSDLIDKIGVRDGDQLSRIVPGTFTVNRWGIAGATQVRGLPADTYLRGMKRIDAQGNIRNVITMWENVEIVRGPPSPIFGNGRIGGYTNYTPKSVRGTTGKYLTQPQTTITGIIASYDRFESQVNYAQPLNFGDITGGFQVFALMNDSDSFYKLNFQRDRVLQASASFNLNKEWRMESGAIYQRAINAGQAGANRVDQSTYDNGTYLRGTALVNLDTDNNGLVSEKEIQDSRNLTGSTVARPLSINFGNVTQLKGPNSIIGAPRTLRELLLNNPTYASVAASPQGQAIINAGNLRFADGSADNSLITNLNATPAGFFLNPAELRYDARDWSLVAIEEKADGYTYTGYLDFVNDTNPNKTQKLQIFTDYQFQQKESQLPFNQVQEIFVFETKYTATRKHTEIPFLKNLPDWAELNLLGSVNARYTDAYRKSTSGDYDHRRDLITGYTPTDTFLSFVRTGDTSFATGEPISADVTSDYWEWGVGAMADATLFKNLGILAGLRQDWIDVTSTDGERFDRLGAGSRTGTFLPYRSISNTDHGLSHSLSISYKTPFFGLTPYITRAKSSSALTGTFQDISYTNVRDKAIISAARLDEAGLKGQALGGKIFYSISAFDQLRTGNVIQEGESYNRATRNRGYEFEARWLPTRNWSVIGTATKLQMYRFGLDPAQTRTAAAHANYIGIADIKDANGNILVPANSFLYGGNSLVVINNSDARFNRFGQYPEWIYGLFVAHNFDNGLSVSWSANWVDSVVSSSELPDLLTLPRYDTHNLTLAYDNKTWRFALQVRNITDEEYATPNNGSFGGMLVQPGLPRNYEFSISRRF